MGTTYSMFQVKDQQMRNSETPQPGKVVYETMGLGLKGMQGLAGMGMKMASEGAKINGYFFNGFERERDSCCHRCEYFSQCCCYGRKHSCKTSRRHNRRIIRICIKNDAK